MITTRFLIEFFFIKSYLQVFTCGGVVYDNDTIPARLRKESEDPLHDPIENAFSSSTSHFCKTQSSLLPALGSDVRCISQNISKCSVGLPSECFEYYDKHGSFTRNDPSEMMSQVTVRLRGYHVVIIVQSGQRVRAKECAIGAILRGRRSGGLDSARDAMQTDAATAPWSDPGALFVRWAGDSSFEVECSLAGGAIESGSKFARASSAPPTEDASPANDRGNMEGEEGGGGGAAKNFTAQDDEDETIRHTFDSADADSDGVAAAAEIVAALARRAVQGGPDARAIAEAAARALSAGPPALDRAAFSSLAGRLPGRTPGARVAWARTLGLAEELARLLPPGDVLDGLGGLRGLQGAERDACIHRVCAGFLRRLPALIAAGLDQLGSAPLLQQPVAAPPASAGPDRPPEPPRPDKSAPQPSPRQPARARCVERAAGAGPLLTDAALYCAEAPSWARPRPPRGDVVDGMGREHCAGPQATRAFSAEDHGVVTHPALEWDFVVTADPACAYPHAPRDRSRWTAAGRAEWGGLCGREPEPLAVFMAHDMRARAGLTEAEVIALRLGTGPMLGVYNAWLRTLAAGGARAGAGSEGGGPGLGYETTLYCLVGGLVKAATASPVPIGRRLWRGFETSERARRGGVEPAFLAATADREAAVMAAGGSGAFEISCGRMDAAADLGWLSQYPEEPEVLLPPLCHVEAAGGARRDAQGPAFEPLRVTGCQKLAALLLGRAADGRRKDLHLAMGANLR